MRLFWDFSESPSKFKPDAPRDIPALNYAVKGTVKVLDAKGLPEGLVGSYVTIYFEGEDPFTTATKWNEPKPFWSESFTL